MFKKIQGFISGIFRQDVARASLFYIIASVFGQGAVLLSSGIFTRMMTKADYGLASTYSTWVLIVNAFICFNVLIAVRNAYVDYKEDYDAFNASVTSLCLFAGIGFTVVLTLGALLLKGAWLSGQVLLVCLQSVGLNLINLKLAVQAMKNEYKQRAWLMCLPNCFHIVLSFILMLIFSKHMYMAKVGGNAAGILVFGIAAMLSLFAVSRPKINLDYWKYALQISVPSIFHTLSDLLLMQCDRLMLTSMIGAEETAEYSTIYNVGSIIVILYQSINGAWTPWFYKKAAAGEKADTRKYHGYYMLFFFLMTCGVLTFSPELIKIISPSSYWGGMQYLGLIAFASFTIFIFAFFSTYLLFGKRTKQIAFNTTVAAVLNIALNYVLIPKAGGATGAAIATVISYAVLFALQLITIGKEGRSYFAIGQMWMVLAAMAVYCVVFTAVLNRILIRYTVLAVLCVLMYIFFGRKIIGEFSGNKSVKK